jgi:hypothetical protein
MQLRITRPLPPRFDGFDTQALQLNHTYDVGQTLADLLIIRGFAVAAGPTLSTPGRRQTSHFANDRSEGSR